MATQQELGGENEGVTEVGREGNGEESRKRSRERGKNNVGREQIKA